MNININQVDKTIEKIKLILSKYDEISAITGERFNVFSILKLERNEVRTHSAFIGELLNPKGSHGFKSVFLELFIETIYESKKSFFDDNNLNHNIDFESSDLRIEEFIGNINSSYSEGGRIDIVIKDQLNNSILIENKIDASEQTNQLIRYHNKYPNATILYLTLFGEDSVSKNDIPYVSISYSLEIIMWLQKCFKEASDSPMIREVIKQYINLIKKITNQTSNNFMKEEIIKILSKDVRTCFEIGNSIPALKKMLFSTFYQNLQLKLSSRKHLSIEVDEGIGSKDTCITIFDNTMENKVVTSIYFLSNNYNDVAIGIHCNTIDLEKKELIKIELKNQQFGTNRNFPNWYYLSLYNKFSNVNSSDFWENVSSMEFAESVCNDVDICLGVISKVFQ